MNRAIERLQIQARRWGVELDRRALSLMSSYADMLAEYETSNVIGTKNREKIVLEHLVDAMSCFVIEDLRLAASLIDVGSGGGLPGIPLGIARPQLSIVLLEATQKKVRFLEHVVADLELHNIEVTQARAEEAGKQPPHREAFDLATSRALAALPVAVEYCAPLVGIGGAVIAMKGCISDQELSSGVAASRELGLNLREVRDIEYTPQIPPKDRRLIVFDKVEKAPARFPRRVGIAKKRPLGDSG